MRRITWMTVAVAAIMATAAMPVSAQMATDGPAAVAGAKAVTIERIKVHAPTIEGNLEGDAADRDVLVVLPPSYGKDRARRYPVVYALHGYSIGAEQWSKEIHLATTAQNAFAKGAKEMILVLPDSKTVHNGSMYSRSVTTGDFETFIARDLIAYIDGHYRTIARRESRGLAGHSMGGYGTSRIGMKHADMFGALYMMSPCCLSARSVGPTDAASIKAWDAVRTPANSAKLPFMLRGQLAAAAAWSPNPKNPPLYLDLPVKDGMVRDEVLAKWAANAPLAFVDQYIGDLRRYKAIAIDVGDKDGLKGDAQALHEVLDRNGIGNSFAIYEGDHTNRVAWRFQDQVLPFFDRHLDFATGS
ncbi:alpha/beta hydrolase [Sphingobium sp. HWE2-09]|uniref:alpha/beta hydrolase n=1 Tax=Sphingobium sp. HWE2-09 TaxID=3108390 RepID=UPI002DC2C264|nr:alpha/beta hydrolase-fold protein [Sphingobium sp. HWE2-09]